MALARTDAGSRVSTVLGRKLGGELLRLRDAAGLTQPQAAAALSASAAKVAKMERGWVPMRDPDIRALCGAYGASDPGVVGHLLELAKADRDRRKAKGWWNQYPELRDMTEYVALENVTTSIRAWQLSLVPGLLQTPEYARALAVDNATWDGPDAIERFVEARIARQRRLTEESPLEVRALIHEGALHQLVGGREVMRQQLDHLRRVAQRSNVEVRVLPYRAGAHPGMTCAFSILSFAEPGAIDVVYMETPFSSFWMESREDAARHDEVFDRIARHTLDQHESGALINRISKEI